MRRTLSYLCLLAALSLCGACATSDNANSGNGNATRNGVIDTNANVRNLNASNAPSNVGVLQNDNGNKNTSGVSTINSNGGRTGNTANHNGRAGNANH